MDSERNVDGEGGRGEVVDMLSGETEKAGFARKENETARGSSEKVRVPTQGMPVGMPPVMSGSNDNAGSLAKVDLEGLVTKDGEGIEKEWVSKVRSIVNDTREDPRRREDEFFEVKKDFLWKRFRRKIGGGK